MHRHVHSLLAEDNIEHERVLHGSHSPGHMRTQLWPPWNRKKPRS